MKQLFPILAIVILMAYLSLTSCSLGTGKGDFRDKNLEYAVLTHLDSIPNIEYSKKLKYILSRATRAYPVAPEFYKNEGYYIKLTNHSIES